MTRKALTDDQKAQKRERERLWRAANPDKVHAKNQRAQSKKPDLWKEVYAKRREQHLAYVAAYDAARPDRAKARAKASYYRKKAAGLPTSGGTKEHRRARNANRRAMLRGRTTRITRGFLVRLMVLQQGKCAGCGCDITNSYHADHITPLARSGEHTESNLQLLCPACNMSKHAKDPVVWRQSLGQLL